MLMSSPEIIHIPAGTFLMGTEKARGRDAFSRGACRHPVYVADFSIAKYPVTNAQYYEYVQATAAAAPLHWAGGNVPADKENHPVAYVTWCEALEYCRWLSQTQGRHYVLPTEAQWEKAARSEDGRLFPWGNTPPTIERYNRGPGTSEVTRFPGGASPYGVFDLIGNVWEWTHSRFRPYPYDATDGRETANGDGPRVLCGGVDGARCVTCAHRFRYEPNYRYAYLGFRFVEIP